MARSNSTYRVHLYHQDFSVRRVIILSHLSSKHCTKACLSIFRLISMLEQRNTDRETRNGEPMFALVSGYTA